MEVIKLFSKLKLSIKLLIGSAEIDIHWPWFVLFGAFTANLLAGGIVFSFGILYTDFIDRLQTSPTETSIFVAITLSSSCFVAPLARTMASKLGYRFVTVIGAVLSFVGMLLGCFAPSIQYYYVFFGVLVGCGYGMISVASYMAVEDYFDGDNSIAWTIVSCGLPSGVFLLPLITRALLDTYSFFGTFMILSALMLNCGVCGLLFKPLIKNAIIERDKSTYEQMINPVEADRSRAEPAAEGGEEPVPDEDTSGDENKKLNGHKSRKYKAINIEHTIVVPISTAVLKFDDFLIEEELEEGSSDDENAPPAEPIEEDSVVDIEPTNVTNAPRDVPQPELSPGKGNAKANTLLNVIVGVNDVTMLCDCRIILYLLASVLFSLGFGIPICFYPDVSREYDYSNSKAEWTLSLLGLGGCVGIVCSGFVRRVLAARIQGGSMLIVCISLQMCALSLGFVHYFSSSDRLLLLSTMWFGVFGVVFSFLRRYVVREITADDRYTSAYYFSQWVCGVGYNTGIPAAAWLKDNYTTYSWSFVMAAISCGISALFILPLILMKRPRD